MAIKVLVSGTGKMGREVLFALTREPDLDPVGVVDNFLGEEYISLPDGAGLIPFGNSPGAMLARTRPDVVVDFTHAEWTPGLVRDALEAGVRPVVGTTGLPESFVKEVAAECDKRKLGAVFATNFAIGAVLMHHLARIAAPYFDYAEIIEMHHEAKVDAPSGTSITTARSMTEARETPFTRPATEKEVVQGTRGGEVDGITIHSVRLPGLVAHQEVILGGPGQTLRIRHDSVNRESFMPGVMLAVREVMKREELVLGIERLIGLE